MQICMLPANVICVCVCVCVQERERERERESCVCINDKRCMSVHMDEMGSHALLNS